MGRHITKLYYFSTLFWQVYLLVHSFLLPSSSSYSLFCVFCWTYITGHNSCTYFHAPSSFLDMFVCNSQNNRALLRIIELDFESRRRLHMTSVISLYVTSSITLNVIWGSRLPLTGLLAVMASIVTFILMPCFNYTTVLNQYILNIFCICHLSTTVHFLLVN